jgi:hypothetical protein
MEPELSELRVLPGKTDFWERRVEHAEWCERRTAERELEARQKQERKAARKAAQQRAVQQRAAQLQAAAQQAASLASAQAHAEQQRVDTLAAALRQVDVLVKAQAAQIAESELTVKTLAEALAQSAPPTRTVTKILHDADGRITGSIAQPEPDARLEERIHELEQRKGFEYRGTWDATSDYAPGDFVTHNGSMWAARIQSHAVKPGEGACWQLCVKRGRDGRSV